MQAVMKDPIIAADGHTYERSGFTQWLAQHGGISAVTGKKLVHNRMVPNVIVKSLIANTCQPGAQQTLCQL